MGDSNNNTCFVGFCDDWLQDGSSQCSKHNEQKGWNLKRWKHSIDQEEEIM